MDRNEAFYEGVDEGWYIDLKGNKSKYNPLLVEDYLERTEEKMKFEEYLESEQ